MDILTIDIETFYSKDYSLSKATTESYVNDIRFEVIGVAVKINDEQTEWYTGSFTDIKQHLEAYDWANSMVVAHNAMFDGAILGWRFGIYPKAIICTLSMARAIHPVSVGGSLATLSQHYNLGAKGTEVLNALGKRREDFTEQELNAYAGYCINDVELTYKLFKVMMPKVPTPELKLIDMTIQMYTKPELMLDTEMLYAHLADVREQKEKLLEECGVSKDDLMSNQKFAAVLEMLGVEPPMKKNAKDQDTYAFAKTDEGFKALAEHDDPRVQAIVAARLGTKSTLEETRTMRFIEISERPYRNSVLPVPLKYCGALTTRFSALDSINLQNVPRGSKLKEAIIAPAGYCIVGADLSNIELRVGLWLAGQMDKLELLQNGVDLYKDFASSVFAVPYAEVTKEQRFIGKFAQLSLIFSVGANKLRTSIKQASNVDIGEAEAKRIVDVYRTEYYRVAELWRTAGDAIQAMNHNQYTSFGYRDLLPVYGKQGVLLPSGLFMAYPDLQVRKTTANKSEWVYKKDRNRYDRLYGGKLMQNCTQAVARCVMSEALLRINKRYRVVLTVHDSVYCVVSDDEADEAYAWILQELAVSPSWLPGIVLGAEGGVSKCLKGAG